MTRLPRNLHPGALKMRAAPQRERFDPPKVRRGFASRAQNVCRATARAISLSQSDALATKSTPRHQSAAPATKFARKARKCCACPEFNQNARKCRACHAKHACHKLKIIQSAGPATKSNLDTSKTSTGLRRQSDVDQF